jgi:hypothetical protein
MMMENTIFEPILEIHCYSTIASGATPIGSAERAPDDVYYRALEHGKQRNMSGHIVIPIGSEFLWLYNPNIFSQVKTTT